MIYQNPMTALNDGSMIRAFADEVNRAGSELGKHPEDYDLMKIGEFDDATGIITPLSVALPLGKALTFKTGA